MTKSINQDSSMSRRGFLSYCATTTTLLASGSVLAQVASSAPSGEPAPNPGEAPRGILRGVVTTTPSQSRQHAVVYLENAALEKVTDATLDDIKLTFVPNVSVTSLKPSWESVGPGVMTGLLVSKNTVNMPSRVRAGLRPSAAGSGNCP